MLAGHDHSYERIVRDGFPYFVNGLGGNGRYWFVAPVGGSEVRFNSDYGAMLIEATPDQIAFQFITRGGELIDSYTVAASGPAGSAPLARPSAHIKPTRPNPFLRPSQSSCGMRKPEMSTDHAD